MCNFCEFLTIIAVMALDPSVMALDPSVTTAVELSGAVKRRHLGRPTKYERKVRETEITKEATITDSQATIKVEGEDCDEDTNGSSKDKGSKSTPSKGSKSMSSKGSSSSGSSKDSSKGSSKHSSSSMSKKSSSSSSSGTSSHWHTGVRAPSCFAEDSYGESSSSSSSSRSSSSKGTSSMISSGTGSSSQSNSGKRSSSMSKGSSSMSSSKSSSGTGSSSMSKGSSSMSSSGTGSSSKSSSGSGSSSMSKSSSSKSLSGSGSSSMSKSSSSKGDHDHWYPCIEETEENTCPIPNDVVQCGQTITGHTTLKTSLQCNDIYFTNMGLKSAALYVEGPDAVLDCGGNGDNIVFRDGTTSSDTVGIYVRNGATVKNCYVKGFGYGVILDTGTSTIRDSKVFGNMYGIRTRNEGCYTIENTIVAGSGDEGLDVVGSGTLIVKETDVLLSGRSGIKLLPPVGTTLYVALENTNIFASQAQKGIDIGSQTTGANHPFGTITLEFFGINKIIDNGHEGIEEDSPDALAGGHTVITVFGEVEIDASVHDGIDLADGTVVVMEDGAKVSSCNNNQGDNGSFDIDVGASATFYSAATDNIVCRTLDTDAASQITCIDECPPNGTAMACSL